MSEEKKISKLFKGTFSEEEFRKKILRKLYIHEYRNYINEVFTRDSEGKYKLKENLGKKDIKKLKSIAKSIKSNEGFVLRGKLALILIFLIGIIVFNIVFLDRLLERAIERNLETIFEAKADMRGLDLQIFKGRLLFQSLEVANSRKPFRNLFELGEVDLQLDIEQLVRNKVVINNVKLQEIRWDTERKTSGALPGARVSKAEEMGEEEGKTFVGAFLEDAGKVVADIIKKEMENIKSPKLLEELPRKYTNLKMAWEETLKGQKKELENLPKLVEPVKAIKLENIKTADEALSAYNMVDETYKSIKLTETNLIKSYDKLKTDLVMANNDKKNVSATISSDLAYLSSFIKSPEKGEEIASAILDPYIEKYLGEIHGKFKRWNYYFEKLKPMIKRKEGRELILRAYGRDVTYPCVAIPKFWLQNMDVSLGSNQERNLYSVKATDITSDQNVINNPTTFSIKRIKSSEEVEWAGLIDKRENREKSAEFDFKAKNIPFVLGEGMKALKVSSVKGTYNLYGELSFDRLNRAGGTLHLQLSNLALDLSDKEDKIAANIKGVLSSNPVDIEVSYTVSEDGKYTFKIKSNLDKLISGTISKLVTEWVNETKAKLDAELNNLLRAKLEEYQDNYKGFISLEEDLKGNLREVKTYTELVEKKKQELQKKIDEKKTEAKGKVEDKAKEEVEKLKEKIKLPF
ncbi:TIGR03545 family protein [candidate division WOR-3 bacterium]|nr:TIGR03545 family protein [candidate division WOR-3 bacterium]